MLFTKKKHIIEIGGGLGNQMFKYAFYLQFKKHFPETCIDISSYKNTETHNGFELEKIFNLKPNYCNEVDLINIWDKNKSLLNKIKRKINGYKPSVYSEHEYDYRFKSDIFNYKKPIYLEGCWLSEKYFEKITDEVRNVFSFQPFDDEKNIKIKSLIENNQSVSIHIRKGDYENNEIYSGICTLNYYKNAVKYIKEKISNPLFIIFSDDSNSILQEFSFLNIDEFLIVNWNIGENSYKDMQLMSLCKHNIIAHSTFSWWGAWLNKNIDKIVISPTKWFNSEKLKNIDIIPEDWIKISE